MEKQLDLFAFMHMSTAKELGSWNGVYPYVRAAFVSEQSCTDFGDEYEKASGWLFPPAFSKP